MYAEIKKMAQDRVKWLDTRIAHSSTQSKSSNIGAE